MGMLLLNGSSDFNPRTLFSNNEQGLWLDPSDMSTLYQDSNGVTPCTAAGDPVGLILDQSRGGLGALGSELFSHSGAIPQGESSVISNQVYRIYSSAGSLASIQINGIMVVGRRYRVEFTVDSVATSGSGLILQESGAVVTTTGQKSFIHLAGDVNFYIKRVSGATDYQISNISVREVPGNHAYQTTSASRPTLARIPSSGRRNLIIYSEDLSNAAWVNNGGTVTSNSTIAPDGTTTADTLTRSTAATEGRYQTVAFTGDGAKSVSVYVKAGTAPSLGVWLWDVGTANRLLAAVDMTGATPIVTLTAGASSAVENVGNGWFRLTFVSTSVTAANTNRLYLMPAYGGASANGQTSIFWGAMAENAASATNYQKVGSTHDVTESGVSDLWHLVFDGSDDSLVTNAVDFSATDEMTVIAGLRKLSDASQQMIAELSAVADTTNGSFNLQTFTDQKYYFGSRGSVFVFSASSAIAAPITNVLSGSADVSGDSLNLRINGVQAASSSSDQGSGNYGNHIIYIGRRGGSSLPYNGHIYQLIVRGKTTPTGKLLEAERFTARKTGLSI